MRTDLSIKGGKYLLTPISCISLIEVACFKSKSSDVFRYRRWWPKGENAESWIAPEACSLGMELRTL